MNRARLVKFFSDWHIIVPISGVIFLLSISWIYALVAFNAIPDRIVLHVNTYGEIDILGTHGEIYGILGAWTVFILLDIYIAYALYVRKPLWAQIFLYGVVPIALLSLLFIKTLVSLNA